MKKLIALGLVGLGLAGCGEELENEEVKIGVVGNEEGIGADVQESLQERRETMKDKELKISVDKVREEFAMGGVTEAGTEGVGGGAWLAVNEGDGWKVIWDGNGQIDCESVNEVAFPNDWVTECWDGEKQVQRD